MKTSFLMTACRVGVYLGLFVTLLGVCAALGAVVSETPDGIAMGLSIAAAGTGVLVAAAATGFTARRSRVRLPRHAG